MKNWILGLLLGFTALVYSQECNLTINGVVHDFHEGTPLLGAVVQIKETNSYTLTDAEGNFSFHNLCKGNYTIVVSHHECNAVTKTCGLLTSTSIDIDLEHHLEKLEKVFLRGIKGHKEAISSVENTLSKNDLNKTSNLDLARSIEKITGVNSYKTGNSIAKPVIHGLHSSRLGIVDDEVRLQDQEWGAEHSPSLSTDGIKSVTVVKGASVLEYGVDMIGGAVVLKPNKPIQKDTLTGVSNTSYVQNGRGVHQGIELNKYYKSGYYISSSGSYKMSGDIKTQDYNISNTGFKNSSFKINAGKYTFKNSWKIGYSFFKNELAIPRFTHIGSTSDLVAAINRTEPFFIEPFTYDITYPKQEIVHHTLKLEHHQRFKGLGKWKTNYSYQHNTREEFDIRRGGRSNIPVMDLTLQTHQLKSTFNFDKNEAWSVKLGTQNQYQINFPDPATGFRRFIPDYKKLDLGLFGTAKYEYSPTLIFDFGLRGDLNFLQAKKFYIETVWNDLYAADFSSFFRSDVGTQIYTEPEFIFLNFGLNTGFWKEINHHFDVRTSINLSQRAPNAAELFSDGLHQASASLEYGDLGLKNEKGVKLLGEFAFHNQKSHITLTPYANLIDDFIYLRPTGLSLTIRGSYLTYQYTQNKVLISGVDLDINHHFTDKLETNFSGSYIYGENLEEETPLIDIPPNQLKLDLQYNFTDNLNSKIAYQYTARQNKYPNYNFLHEGVLVDISTPPGDYQLYNLETNYKFNLKRTSIDLGLRVNNILDKSYRSYLNQFRYFTDEQGRNITLLLTINF